MADTQGIWSPDDGGTYDPPADLLAMAESIANRIAATMIPTGSIVATGRSTAPSGWIICNGAAISRTTYANLFAAIGTTFGNGDGSTTFELPNLKGRVVAGADGAQSDFQPLGKTGGAKTVVLTGDQIPSSGDSRTVDSTKFATGTSNAPLVSGSGSRHGYKSSGGTEGHNNLQPYMALHYIIKA